MITIKSYLTLNIDYALSNSEAMPEFACLPHKEQGQLMVLKPEVGAEGTVCVGLLLFFFRAILLPECFRVTNVE